MSGINKVGGGTPILPIDQGQDATKPAAAARPGLSTAPPPAVPFEHQFLSAHATHAGAKATATDGVRALGKIDGHAFEEQYKLVEKTYRNLWVDGQLRPERIPGFKAEMFKALAMIEKEGPKDPKTLRMIEALRDGINTSPTRGEALMDKLRELYLRVTEWVPPESP